MKYVYLEIWKIHRTLWKKATFRYVLNRKFIQNEKLVTVLYVPINSFISNLIFVSISLFLFQAFLLSSIAGMSNGPLLCRTYLPMPNWQLWLQLSLLVLSNLVLAHHMISRILSFLFAIAFSWKKWLFHKENNSSRSVNLRMTFWWLYFYKKATQQFSECLP